MIKLTKTLACIALVSTLATSPAWAQEKKDDKGKDPKPAEKAEGKKKGGQGFTGKVTAVDATAKTVTLSGKTARVLQVSSQTRIEKDGKPATFDDIKVGEEVTGSYKKVEDKLEASLIRIGGPAPKKKGDDKKEEKKDDKK
ncbi:MAG: hypothetical protein HY300_19215 [Verrucomicrobia bacterium]|nr:hypothetical protein [Verrucomicrobiota bacterium]